MSIKVLPVHTVCVSLVLICCASAKSQTKFSTDGLKIALAEELHTSLAPNRVAFSPDGNRIAIAGGNAGSKDTAVNLWEIGKSKTAIKLSVHKRNVSDLCFVDNGEKLVSVGRGGCHIWDFRDGRSIVSFRVFWPGKSVAYHPDSRMLFIGSVKSSGYTVSGGEVPDTITTVSIDHLMKLKGDQELFEQFEGELLTGRRRSSAISAGLVNVNSVRILPEKDAVLVYGGYRDADATQREGAGVLTCVNAKTGKIQFNLEFLGEEVRDIAFSKNETLVACLTVARPTSAGLTEGNSRAAVGGVLLFKVASGTTVGRIGETHGNLATSIAWSQATDTLFIGYEDGAVRVFDASSKTEVLNFVAHDRAVVALATDRQGRFVATGDQDGNIRIWKTSRFEK